MPIGSIVGGLIGQGGAQAAGGAAAAAGQQAFGNAKDQIAEDRGYLSPWTQTGTAAASQLSALYGLGKLNWDGGTNFSTDTANAPADQAAASAKFFTSPGYDFRLTQGVNALDRSAASRGMLLSGAQTKGVQDYGQGQASQEWGNYINQLNSLSGAGLGATESGNNTTANIFNAGNNDQFAGGMGRANGYQNAANALGSGISGGINSLASLAAFGYGAGWFGGAGAPIGANAAGMAGNPMTTALSAA